MTQRKHYPSDVTDSQWAIIEPLIPAAKPGGRPRTSDMREVWNAIQYVLTTGCQWAALPHDLPPRGTAHHYFRTWAKAGTLDSIHEQLRARLRKQAKRDPEPTRAIIDAQSVKTTDVGGEKQGVRRGQEDQGPQAPHRRG